MDLKDTEKNIDQVDGILTKLKNLLIKHWGIILFLLVVYIVYWAFTSPDVPVTEIQIEKPMQTASEIESEIYQPIVGDTIWTSDTTYYIYE